jgi:hypothetical protein
VQTHAEQLDRTHAELPLDVYRRLSADCRDAAARLGRWDTGIVWARLCVLALAIATVVLAIKKVTPAAALLVPAGLFAALAAAHGRVLARIGRIRARDALYAAGIDRLEDRWIGRGDGGERFGSEAHLYAPDLDLYGRGGLYELLSTARTPVGARTLARWLEGPADAETVRRRQAAVAELARRRDLREQLALAGATIKEEVREDTLTRWAGAPPAPLPALPLLRLGIALVGAAVTALGALWLAGVTSGFVFVAAATAGWLVTRRLRPALAGTTRDVERRSSELSVLASAMALLERGSFQAPALQALAGALAAEGLPPSRQIARLRLLVALLDAGRNQLMALLVAPLLWSTQLGLAIEAWRRRVGPVVGRWLAAVGELEALSSLATFSFEHPEYPFPEIADAPDGGPVLQALALGHPLIPASRRVTNDLALGGSAPHLLVVSGSNMSGKSTLLRTVGVNTVLALAGAPVAARSLTLSPVAMGATLRIHDSLQAGQSRFYAELTRLQQIVALAKGPPPLLLFLFDEILHGTNSHDRRVGAEAILRGLVARGAIGLVTTHDLALAEIADALAPRADNAHFQDHLEDGVMSFDYRMRPGVVTKSNALALMRAVGLEV